MPRLPYDPIKDFTPIAHLADAASVLLVTPSLPVKSVAELIAYAKKHPDQLNYASSGNGTIVHLTTEAFKAQAGVFITHVPYKGTALAIPDVIAGSVQVLIDAIPSGMPHVKSGRLQVARPQVRLRKAHGCLLQKGGRWHAVLKPKKRKLFTQD